MDLLADAVCVRERRTLCRARLTGTPGGVRQKGRFDSTRPRVGFVSALARTRRNDAARYGRALALLSSARPGGSFIKGVMIS
jgi:hypothetical protein